MRYAIYFATPETSSLMQLGNRWLGRDPFTGQALDQPAIDGLSAQRFAELTTDPRRYGFHGTLRAPFHIRDGLHEADLLRVCETFAARTAPFTTTGLSVNALGRFLALTPSEPDAALNTFANACVRHFEPCRAPLDDADLARRRRSGLTPRHDELLQAWGYPYVFDAFRFHMTLSNKLEDDVERSTLNAAARAFFAPVTGEPMHIQTFGLYQEVERGAPFTVHTIFTLAGAHIPAEADPTT
ncbi:DUF1045 domain-containing protein [Roseibium sp. CAU 1637]|uniref:DUF1045 domain-containing protein n=1 Tax=Roseibium limicola TaxID=2816037 RepID=A0A939EPX9_9HYPH|nr:DUF1045 domain-containing protein [Roseibium limicola]MBO0346780.1 DUF1045 domain-containing protein [Roseibium limicola]